MTYATVDFDSGKLYVGNRPRGDVVLRGPGGRHGTTWTVSALVDTGADFMHLPTNAAGAVGLSLAGARPIQVSTGGGIVRFQQAPVDVEIEGVNVKIPVNFGPNAPALIGRQAIFAVLDKTGFTTAEWLLKWKAQSGSAPAAQAPGSTAASSSLEAATGIVDHGSWLQIGGVAIAKRMPRRR